MISSPSDRILRLLLLWCTLTLLGPLVTGCRWAQVRYLEGAENSLRLTCYPDAEQPNALNCWDSLKDLQHDGVMLVPAPKGKEVQL